MKFTTRFFLLVTLGVLSFSGAMAQKARPVKPPVETVEASPLSSSAAYAEILLKRTQLQSDLESLILEYTEEFPKVKELRHVLGLIDRDVTRLSKVKAAEAAKLTLALGKLIVRRIELETDMWNLQRNYKDEHPDVKRAKRKVEIYESAISEVLK